MSEILTIDTGTSVVQERRLDPLPLYDENHPMLKSPITEYQEILPNPQMTNLIQQLKMTLKKFGGIGLSANQCGVFERVFVIGYGDESFACINPRVVEFSPEIERDREGCLSYPGMYLTIPRHKWIIAEYINENGEVVQRRLDGLSARCYLHELDHMNGIRFVEHVGAASIRLARDRQEKHIKKMQRKMKNKKSIYF